MDSIQQLTDAQVKSLTAEQVAKLTNAQIASKIQVVWRILWRRTVALDGFTSK